MRQRKRLNRHKTRRFKQQQQQQQEKQQIQLVEQDCCKRKRLSYEHILQHFQRNVRHFFELL